jgi:hypothetical protein
VVLKGVTLKVFGKKEKFSLEHVGCNTFTLMGGVLFSSIQNTLQQFFS